MAAVERGRGVCGAVFCAREECEHGGDECEGGDAGGGGESGDDA